MIRSAFTLLTLALLVGSAPSAFAQVAPADPVTEEAVRRQEMSIILRKTLADAQAEQKLGDYGTAAKLYEEAWGYVQKIGETVIEKEHRETVQGFSHVYLELAKKSHSRGQYNEAKSQVSRVLRVDPKNRDALSLAASVDKALREQEGRVPSKETVALMSEVQQEKTTAATLVQDGKLLYEMGRLQEAADKLREAMKLDPQNQGAFYYARLVEEAVYSIEARKREAMAKWKMVEVERAWNPPVKWGNITNTTNPFARTNTIYTGAGRRVIFSKLEKIRFNQYPVSGDMPGVPLSVVVKDLDEEVKQRDPDKKGLNFILAPYVDVQTASALPMMPGQIDPMTGQPIGTAPQQEQFDLGSDVLIKIEPPLKDVRLMDVLDTIIKVANKQIKYSVEDYAIVFTRKIPEQEQLFTRQFRVNPNTFVQGLEGVIGEQFVGASISSDSSGTGTSSGGGTMGGMGGGMSGGYGGGGGYMIPRVDVTGYGGMGGMGGMGGGMGGMGGGMMGGMGGGMMGGMGGGMMGGMGGGMGGGSPMGYMSTGGSLMGVNRMTDMSVVNQMVVAYFSAAGVNLGGSNLLGGGGMMGGMGGGFTGGGFQNSAGKSVFYNDRLGLLLVRATLQDLDIIEAAIQVLNLTPDQITIEAKFVEIGQDDAKALGFDWLLGNFLMRGGGIGLSGGTYPSVAGESSPANPSGVFPGIFGVPSALPNSGTDQILTQGLRNSDAEGSPIPAIGTITGILTDPQFRVVIRALEQRSGVDMLAAPKVTTVSGRQAQIQSVDIRQIVTGLDVGTSGAGGAVSTGTGATGTTGTGQ